MDKEKLQKEVKKRAVRKTKRTAKKKLRRTHPLSFVIWALALIVGVGIGVGACALICSNDGFTIVGESDRTLPINQKNPQYVYRDEGVRIVSFGRDISDRVTVQTNMIGGEDGVYGFDVSKDGFYYIIYTVDDPRFGEIKRIRTFTVGEGE